MTDVWNEREERPGKGTPLPSAIVLQAVVTSAVDKRLIGEVVQSRLKAATTAFTFKTLLRHYAERALAPR